MVFIIYVDVVSKLVDVCFVFFLCIIVLDFISWWVGGFLCCFVLMCLFDRVWRWVWCFCFFLRLCVRIVVCYGLFWKFKVFMYWWIFFFYCICFLLFDSVYVFCYNLIWFFYLIGVYMVFVIIWFIFLINKSVRKNELEY